MDYCGVPSFIRNIVDIPRQLQDLIIPKAFVKDNPTIFPGMKSAIVQVRGGRDYKVNVIRKGGNILFTGGWRDFSGHYAIDLGYFLVFYYRGNSRFEVGIADTSNCEIDYTPYHCRCAEEAEAEAEAKAKTETEVETEEDNIVANVQDRGIIVVSDLLERAELFPCQGPSFTVAMNISYLSKDYRMWVPLAHGHRYLKNGDSKVNLVVDIANGGTRTWKVKLTSGRSSVRFGAGWKQFVKNNHLREEDVCKFELVDRVTQTYMVHIFSFNNGVVP